MSFRIYNSVDMVVILNDANWEVEKFEKGGMWYSYKKDEAPILYTILQRSPERALVLHQPFTAFTDEKGNGFDNDAELQDHLDEVLASKEIKDLETISFGGSNLLAVREDHTNNLLNEIIIQLKINNAHLVVLTEQQITERDLNLE